MQLVTPVEPQCPLKGLNSEWWILQVENLLYWVLKMFGNEATTLYFCLCCLWGVYVLLLPDQQGV